jgi:hypothetical protein
MKMLKYSKKDEADLLGRRRSSPPTKATANKTISIGVAKTRMYLISSMKTPGFGGTRPTLTNTSVPSSLSSSGKQTKDLKEKEEMKGENGE